MTCFIHTISEWISQFWITVYKGWKKSWKTILCNMSLLWHLWGRNTILSLQTWVIKLTLLTKQRLSKFVCFFTLYKSNYRVSHKYLNNFWKVGVASKWVKPCLQNFLCFLSILITKISENLVAITLIIFCPWPFCVRVFVCHKYCILVLKSRRSLCTPLVSDSEWQKTWA